MSKYQVLVVGFAIALILGLYILPIKPSKQADVDRSRNIEMETTDKTVLIRKARQKYTKEQITEVQQLTEALSSYENDSLSLIAK